MSTNFTTNESNESFMEDEYGFKQSLNKSTYRSSNTMTLPSQGKVVFKRRFRYPKTF